MRYCHPLTCAGPEGWALLAVPPFRAGECPGVDRGIALRWVIRWGVSREGRGYIFRAAVAAATLFPLLVVSLDHHGAEHLGTHSHPGLSGEVPHLHEYQIPHSHGSAAQPPSADSPQIVAAVPVVGVALGLTVDAGLPLIGTMIFAAIRLQSRAVSARTVLSQMSLAPATQPPIAVA